MKLISLKAENFLRLHAVEIAPDGAVVQISGANGSGKSSVLNALVCALAGKEAIPADPVRHGAEEAEIVVDLGDIIVRRVIRPDRSTALTVTNKDGFKASESRKHPAAQIGLNTDYLKLFDSGCQFTFGGAHDAVIVRKRGEPNFWGAVMPFRVDAFDDPFPSWCASDDFTPAPTDDAERSDAAIIAEPYMPPEGRTVTVSVNGGPEIDFSETAAVTDALRPVVARAMGVAE